MKVETIISSKMMFTGCAKMRYNIKDAVSVNCGEYI